VCGYWSLLTVTSTAPREHGLEPNPVQSFW